MEHDFTAFTLEQAAWIVLWSKVSEVMAYPANYSYRVPQSQDSAADYRGNDVCDGRSVIAWKYSLGSNFVDSMKYFDPSKSHLTIATRRSAVIIAVFGYAANFHFPHLGVLYNIKGLRVRHECRRPHCRHQRGYRNQNRLSSTGPLTEIPSSP